MKNGNRIVSLDIFRGIAILGMVLSGVIPRSVLPSWMYHAQLPPPGHQFNPSLAGITWVDLVFPMFLLAMGAAIPLSLSKKKKQGISEKRLIIHIIQRWALLVFFAIFLQHIRPGSIDSSYSLYSWLGALIGFGTLTLIYTDWSTVTTESRAIWLQRLGWGVSVACFLGLFLYSPQTPSVYKNDIIILILSQMALIGGCIWVISQRFSNLKWAIFVFVVFLFIGGTAEGSWVHKMVQTLSVPWLIRTEFMIYLAIIIPGMAVGELLQASRISDIRSPLFYVVMNTALLLCLFVGFQLHIWMISSLIPILTIGIYTLIIAWKKVRISPIQQIHLWGISLLFLGLWVEPFQGGIKKDPVTLGYIFISTGASILLLHLLWVLYDFYQTTFLSHSLKLNGRNPMIAYVAFGNLLLPIIALLGIHEWLVQMTSTHALLGLGRGILYTVLVALIVTFFSKNKLYWKT